MKFKIFICLLTFLSLGQAAFPVVFITGLFDGCAYKKGWGAFADKLTIETGVYFECFDINLLTTFF